MAFSDKSIRQALDNMDSAQDAFLVSMPPRRDSKGHPYLPLVYYFPFGTNIALGEDSALVRPFRSILKGGKPAGKITYVFYEDNNEYYVLGSLARTEKRILFFPGVLDRRVTISPEGREILRNRIIHTIDHFSLESDFRTYHVTLLEKESSKTRYRKLNTKRLDDSIFLWFVMSVKGSAMLEDAPMTQEFHLKWNRYSELNHKYAMIQTAREGCIFNIIHVQDNPPEPFFINFEFFVSLDPSRAREPPDGIFQTGLVPAVQKMDLLFPPRQRGRNCYQRQAVSIL